MSGPLQAHLTGEIIDTIPRDMTKAGDSAGREFSALAREQLYETFLEGVEVCAEVTGQARKD
jgi:hypothetical protein